MHPHAILLQLQSLWVNDFLPIPNDLIKENVLDQAIPLVSEKEKNYISFDVHVLVRSEGLLLS